MASEYPETACPCCLKIVLDSEKGIQCDKECQRWFHSVCIGMSDSIYNEFATNVKKVWYCDRVDCSVKVDQLQTMSAHISEILKNMSKLSTKDEITIFNDGIAEIKNDLKGIHRKLNEFEPRLKSTEDRLDIIEEKINGIGDREFKEIIPEDIISELNDRTRRARNVLVYNIPENRSTNNRARISHDKSLMVKLIQVVSLDIGTNDIKVLRLGKPNKDKQRPIKLIFHEEAEARRFNELFSKDLVAEADVVLFQYASPGFLEKAVLETINLQTNRRETTKSSTFMSLYRLVI
ncbi:hypothetical protein J6590_023963 [Homalodisca vitripennis]|nr:hypothetical protein J6590_023963 [Homalodisca vitripennis]